MAWQRNCAIAQQRAAIGYATSVLTAKLHVRSGEKSRDLERWSG
jgi:hypothetical protein